MGHQNGRVPGVLKTDYNGVRYRYLSIMRSKEQLSIYVLLFTVVEIGFILKNEVQR